VAVGSNAGELLVYDATTMRGVIKHDLNSFSKQSVRERSGNLIQAVKFSPNGKTLAIGTNGSVIVLCDVSDKYKPKGTLKAHNTALMHMDFSKDSTALRAVSRDNELLFHTVSEAKLAQSKANTNPSSLSAVDWSTENCVVGWAVQGVYDSELDGTDVNSVDLRPDLSILAMGDEFGKVSIFRYPCAVRKNAKKQYSGHAANVKKVKFTSNGKAKMLTHTRTPARLYLHLRTYTFNTQVLTCSLSGATTSVSSNGAYCKQATSTFKKRVLEAWHQFV
jgi:WD40 repeat protein